jgi:hypothetical protein
MSTISKIALSGETTGHGKLISATTSEGTIVHTPDGTNFEEIWLWAVTASAIDQLVVVEFGAYVASTDHITQYVYANQGAQLIVPGLAIFGDTGAIKVFSTTTNVVSIFGYVLSEVA